MKTKFLYVAGFMLWMSCSGPADDSNKGAQANQDYPSNRNTEMDSSSTASSQAMQDSNMVPATGTPSGTSPNEAPNNGEGNPKQNIHGQTGANQSGQ